MFSKWVENTVGKREIARYEQFLLVFKRLVLQTTQNQGLFQKGLTKNETVDQSMFKAFADIRIKMTEELRFVLGMVENILEKGENAGYQNFLLYPKCFLTASYTGSLKVVIVW